MKQGAQVVDMEAAALIAWSHFRQLPVYQFFYTADYVDAHQQEWERRLEERTADPMVFFDVAFRLAKEIGNEENR